jgi:hypothetical protein
METINKIELPEDMVDVMVTYEKTLINGTKVNVTKRGFYNQLFNNFAIPHYYQHFILGGEKMYLPAGNGAERIAIDKVLKWEYCEN